MKTTGQNVIVRLDKGVVRDEIRFGEGTLKLMSPDMESKMKNGAKSGEVVAVGTAQSLDSFRRGGNSFGVLDDFAVSVGHRVHFKYLAIGAYLDHLANPVNVNPGNVFEIEGDLYASFNYGFIFLNETTNKCLNGYVIGEVIKEEVSTIITIPNRVETNQMIVSYDSPKALFYRGDGLEVKAGDVVEFRGDHIPFDAPLFNDKLVVIQQNQIFDKK
jgi:hypothetical protein